MDGQLRQYTCSPDHFDLVYDHQDYPSVWTAEARQIETIDTLQNVELPSDFPQPSSLSCNPKEIPEGDDEGGSDSSHASMTESLSAWATGHRLDDQEGSEYSQEDITGKSESVGDLEPRYGLRFPISNGHIDRSAWADLAEELRTDIFTRFIMWGKSQPSDSDDLGYAAFQPQIVDVYDTLTRTRNDGNLKDLDDGLLMMVRPESEGEIREKFLNHAKDWVAKQESDWCHPPIYMDPVSILLGMLR